MRLAPLVALLSCLGAVSAAAILVEVDLNSPGDALITRDTVAGLDWLDLTETTGLSVDDVASNVGGWVTSGWRHATTTEVCDLMTEIGLSPTPCPGSVSGPSGNPVQTHHDLLGVTASDPPPLTVITTDGLFADEDPGDTQVGRGTVLHGEDAASGWGIDVLENDSSPSTASPAVGHFLVRPHVNHALQCSPSAAATIYDGTLVGQPDAIADDDPNSFLKFEANVWPGVFAGEATLSFHGIIPEVTRVEIVHELPGSGFGEWTVSLQTSAGWQAVLASAESANFGKITSSVDLSATNVSAIRVEADGGSGNLTTSDYLIYELRLVGPSIAACECDDGLDNDDDLKTDFPDDDGCTHIGDPSEEPDCDDGLDNDGDGLIDYPADSDCLSAGQPLEQPSGSLTVFFTEIAHTSTVAPGTTQPFGSLGNEPALDDGVVAFVSDSPAGIYKWAGGSLGVVANTHTAVPGAASRDFDQFEAPSIDSGNVAFSGRPIDAPQLAGIYKEVAGSLQAVVDSNTQIPSSAETFYVNSFAEVSLSGDIVVFEQYSGGYGDPPAEGIYRDTGGTLEIVADLTTPIPGGSGTFTDLLFGFAKPAVDGGEVVFYGEGAGGQEGLYRAATGSISVVADLSTPVPGGSGSFQDLNLGRYPSIDGGDVAFISGTPHGIYESVAGVLEEVVVDNAPAPGGSGLFSGFIRVSLDGGNIAFSAATSLSGGVYLRWNGPLVKLIELNDSLGGRNVSGTSMGPEGLSGNQVVFRADFTDGSRGLYLATIHTECDDGIDNDGDGFTDHPFDEGCTSESDRTERRDCEDAYDNDGDDLADYPNDPGCETAVQTFEDPECQDGVNNDPTLDPDPGLIDFDGGQSVHGACGGGTCPPGVSDPNADGVADPDPECIGMPWRNGEAPSVCGNAIVDPGEDCDDGNTTAGDCCSPTCMFEGPIGDEASPCCIDGICLVDQPCSVCFSSGTCQQPAGPVTACTCVFE